MTNILSPTYRRRPFVLNWRFISIWLKKSITSDSPLNLGAIDIGSNAVRLLVAQAVPYRKEIDFTKLSLLRLPLRLGLDVFETGKISPEKAELLLKSMQSFKLIMEIYGVQKYRACATSAMRDASNSPEIVAEIKEKTGIEIEVISGREEAAIIYETHLRHTGSKNGCDSEEEEYLFHRFYGFSFIAVS